MLLKIMTLSLTFVFFAGCTNVNSYKGYKTVETTHVTTINSDVVELVHEKSGASIVLIKNKDQATSFMAGFRTPPYDDTGLFHIFEHVVLEGSRLYPSKSNFFNLANSSVASYLNAMTGSVYTLYPFVTRSSQDFDNLMSVYMDAVFFPNTLTDPRLVQREGWRYETNDKTQKMSINGIVLSEMKGAFSSPYRSLMFQLTRSLLPQTPFSYSSGGLPDKIATLTFNQIVDAHKKFYHPQNSIIYLYGDLDYKKQLAKIDSDFLSHFEKQKDYIKPEIKMQTDFSYPTPLVESTYPGEKGENKDFISKGYVIGDVLTQDEKNILSVLMQGFADDDASPLKSRILNEKLAKSVFTVELQGNDKGLGFVFEGSQSSHREKIGEIINEEIDKVVAKGLDQELLTSILNKYEFSYKEKNSNGSHRGMQLGSIVLDHWINPEEPLKATLDFVAQFKSARKLLKDPEFVKNFFKKHFKENTKVRWVVLTPDPEFSKKFNSGLDLLIENALKEKKFEDYSREFKEYQTWVSSKESPEILSKTPRLKLDNIIPDEPAIEMIKANIENTTVLQFPQDTSGISYLNMYFDVSGVDVEQLKNLKLFAEYIDSTETKNYTFEKLSKEINTYIGDISFSVNNFQSVKDPQKFKPSIGLSLRFLNENKDKTMELVQEILTQSQFGPIQRLGQLIEETQSGMQSGVSSLAPGLSSNAATKDFFPDLGNYIDNTSGSVFVNYLLKTKISPEVLQESFRKILKDVFNQNRLYLTTLTTDRSNINNLMSDIKKVKQNLPAAGSEDKQWKYTNSLSYDGFLIPGEVQYVNQATSFAKNNLNYSGNMIVYSQYLDNHFMIPRLREQAGAYGAGTSFSPSGIFKLSTYKDPNLKSSFDIFSQAIDFMNKEELKQEDLTPAILGSLQTYYRDTSIPEKSAFMTGLYLSDQTWDDYIKLKKEILATTPADFKKISEALLIALKDSKKSVSGNADKIKNEASFLKNKMDLR